MKNFLKKLKPHLGFLAVILVCGLAVSTPFFSRKLIQGSDFYFNQARIKSTASALADGQIIPQLDPNAFGGFGHSWNLFYGPLPTYFGGFLRLLTGDWNLAINLMSIILIVSSGFSMYWASVAISKNKRIAIISALLYMLASPIIVTVFRTNNQSRMFVTAFMPLIFSGMWRIFNRQKGGIIELTLSASGIILSHMLSIIIVAFPALIFVAFYWKKFFKKPIFRDFLIAGVSILGFCAFFILPFLETQKLGIYNISNSEFKQTAMSMVAKTAYDSSISPGELLFRNQEYPVSGIYIQLWILILAATIFLFAKNKMPKNIQNLGIIAWAVTAILLFLCSNFVPWSKMPDFFYTLQFPSRRLMPIIALITSFLGGFGIFYFIKNKDNFNIIILSAVVLSFAVLAPTIGFYSREKYSIEKPNLNLVKMDDSREIPHEQSSSIIEPLSVSSGEYLPTALSVAGNRNPNSSRYYSYTISSANFLIERGKTPKIERGNSTISDFQKTGSKMTFSLNFPIKESTEIELPAIYYPGYEAKFEDGQHIETTFSKNGLVLLRIPQGKSGKITTRYGLSTFTKIGLLITTITFLAFAVFYANKVWRIKSPNYPNLLKNLSKSNR